MASEKFRYQLRREAWQWREEGLISPEIYQQLTTRYGLEELDSEEAQETLSILPVSINDKHCNSVFNASAIVSWDVAGQPCNEGAAEIVPGLFLGSARDAELVSALHVTHVLNLSGRPSSRYCLSHAKVMSIEMEDRRGYRLNMHFEACLDFIRKGLSEGGILVHCEAGVNRSVAIVAAYLLVEKNVPLSSVLRLLREKRGLVLTNVWFIAELVILAEKLDLLDL